MRVRVETRVNVVGDHEPCRFAVGPQCLEVRNVLDRWLNPDHGYFKVEADDGAIYILRRDDLDGVWELTLYQSPRQPPAPPMREIRRPQ